MTLILIKDTQQWKISYDQDPCQGHCQTNLGGAAKGAGVRGSGSQLTLLGQGGRAVLFEDIAGVEVTAEVEVVVD